MGRTELSVQMAKPGDSVFYRDHYESIEVVRRALETERPIIVHERLVNELLNNKWENPMMGLMGAHLFLAALERDRNSRAQKRVRRADLQDNVREGAADTLHALLTNLGRVLKTRSDSLSNDLIALHLRAQPFTQEEREFGTISEPPIFWASWEILRAHSVPGGPVAISRQLYSRVAQSYPAGPYFAWRAGRRIGIEAQVAALMGDAIAGAIGAPSPFGLIAALGANLPAVGLADDAPFNFNMKRVARLSQNVAREDIAAALGAPLSLVARIT